MQLLTSVTHSDIVINRLLTYLHQIITVIWQPKITLLRDGCTDWSERCKQTNKWPKSFGKGPHRRSPPHTRRCSHPDILYTACQPLRQQMHSSTAGAAQLQALIWRYVRYNGPVHASRSKVPPPMAYRDPVWYKVYMSLHLSGISIRSAVFAQFTRVPNTHSHTDHTACDKCRKWPNLRTARRPFGPKKDTEHEQDGTL